MLPILEMVPMQSVSGIGKLRPRNCVRRSGDSAEATALPEEKKARRNAEIAMRSLGWNVALVLAAGLAAMAPAKAFSQTPAYGESLLPASEPVTIQPTEEATTVQAALREFDSALAAHDVVKMQAVGIKRVTAKGWQKFFKDNPRATVTDRCLNSDLYIADSTASWTCTETATIISEGKPRAFVNVIRFTFSKTNGRWMIADRR